MTQNSIKVFIAEIYSKSPKKNYPTNKTNVYHFDDIWSIDKLDFKDYGPGNNRNNRYVLVVIDNFSRFGSKLPRKKMLKQQETFSKIIL